MASIERSNKINKKTRSQKLKTNPSSKAIEVERIITQWI
jgi:hypothetical protein